MSTDYLLGNTDDPTPPNMAKKATTVVDTAEALLIFFEDKLERAATEQDMRDYPINLV